MSRTLRVLIVEDDEADAELLLREVKRGGYSVSFQRVQTIPEMRAALEQQAWDIVLADYSLPQFSALGALNLLRETGIDVPFIIISGTIGEETAVEALKAGAHDFLVKNRLARLLPAIERELAEAAIRRERRDAIADLNEAVRARDEFLSIASHELKTPITSLELQLASVLKLVRSRRHREVPPEKLEFKLKRATAQIHRLTALINTLLDVTRITSGGLKLSRTQVDFGQLVTGVLDRFSEAIKSCNSEVMFFADQPVIGSWDAIVLEAVVTNLVSNSVKFGQGKPINVMVSREEDVARLTVVDHGMGISQEDQSRIFQRFERAVPSKHFGGFGIGLWVAQQVVEAHGGTIRVSSREGLGSTFTVELPVEPSRTAV